MDRWLDKDGRAFLPSVILHIAVAADCEGQNGREGT